MLRRYRASGDVWLVQVKYRGQWYIGSYLWFPSEGAAEFYIKGSRKVTGKKYRAVRYRRSKGD